MIAVGRLKESFRVVPWKIVVLSAYQGLVYRLFNASEAWNVLTGLAAFSRCVSSD